MRRWLAGVVAGTVALAGCGEEEKALPESCTAGAATIARALAAAPGDVRLPGGTPLSECIRLGTSQAESQNVGVVLLRTADGLLAAIPRDDAAALRLGFLVGATKRGAARTNGLQIELARRMEQVVGIGGPPPARRAAYRRGMRAGEDHG
jgi:hypothetical protein